MNIDRIIGNNIRLLVRMQNSTFKVLALDIDMSQPRLSYLVNGHGHFSAYELFRISKALNVSMERLMEGVK